MSPLLLYLLAGCSGADAPSADAEIAERLLAECSYAEQSVPAPAGEVARLAELNAPPMPVGIDSDAPRIRVREGGLRIGFERGWRFEPVDLDALVTELDAYAGLRGVDQFERALLIVDAPVPGARTGPILEQLETAGVGEVWLVVRAGVAPTAPAWLHPEYAAELTAELNAAPGGEAAVISGAMKSLIGAPGEPCAASVGSVFQAMGQGAPDQKCALVAEHLPPALGSCDESVRRKIATAIQASRGELQFLTALPVALGQGAPKVAPETTWQAAVSGWAQEAVEE